MLHWHIFKEYNREFLYRQHLAAPMFGGEVIKGVQPSPVTVITYKCEREGCTKHKQVILEGHISLKA